MRIHLEYGETGLDLEIRHPHVKVIEPAHAAGLPDEAAAFRDAARRPIGGRPLRETARTGDRVALLIPDITRPFPAARMLPWALAELAHIRNFVIVVGNGSHRAATAEELGRLVGGETLRRCRVVQHDAHDAATMVDVGRDPGGGAVRMNREYAEADRRVVLGFIEPHFLAGFSGGYKAAFPGVADIGSIMRYHGAAVVGHPGSTWGQLEENPTQALVRACGSLAPVDFCINVTLNRERKITGYYCGDPIAAHEAGCAAARHTVMIPCERRFPVVVTTNSGYPLDQNLYQTVKGLSAAAQAIEPGGLILAASECRDGFPEHGNFRRLLFEYGSPQALLDAVTAPGFHVYDQWEAQLLALVQVKARVALKSRLAEADARRAHIEPVEDLSGRLAEEMGRLGPDAEVAVLPEGPQAIPYLTGDQ
jgi:lactate racemase